LVDLDIEENLQKEREKERRGTGMGDGAEHWLQFPPAV
jgi:hypothetical protein